MKPGTATPASASHLSWRRRSSPARRNLTTSETAEAISSPSSATSARKETSWTANGAGPNGRRRCSSGGWNGSESTTP